MYLYNLLHLEIYINPSKAHVQKVTSTTLHQFFWFTSNKIFVGPYLLFFTAITKNISHRQMMTNMRKFYFAVVKY